MVVGLLLGLMRKPAESKCTRGENREARTQLFDVPVEHRCYQSGLYVWLETRECAEYDFASHGNAEPTSELPPGAFKELRVALDRNNR